MKTTLTRFEKFALTSHLVGQPSPSPEHGRRRLRAWDALGTSDLADTLAMGHAGFGGEIKIADWSDRKTPEDVDIPDEIVEFIKAGTAGQVAGPLADVLTRVRARLESAAEQGGTVSPLKTAKSA